MEQSRPIWFQEQIDPEAQKRVASLFFSTVNSAIIYIGFILRPQVMVGK